MSNEPITFKMIYPSSDYSRSFLIVSKILENHRREIQVLRNTVKELRNLLILPEVLENQNQEIQRLRNIVKGLQIDR